MDKCHPYQNSCLDPFNQNSNNIALVKINENMKNKNNTLVLKNMNLYDIPDLSEHIWIDTLILSDNHLTTIDADALPPNVKTVSFMGNNITKVLSDNIPDSIEHLILGSNFIHTFDGKGMHLKNLNLTRNALRDIITFPDECESMNISNNKIAILPEFPKNLRYIDCTNNNIEKINDDVFNEGLLDINLTSNKLYEFPIFPDSVEKINLESNKIERFYLLPLNIKDLNVSYNLLRCDDLYDNMFQSANNLTDLKLSGNYLDTIPILPENLEHLEIDDNEIKYINSLNINDKLQTLSIKENDIDEIPKELLIRQNLIIQHSKKKSDDYDTIDHYSHNQQWIDMYDCDYGINNNNTMESLFEENYNTNYEHYGYNRNYGYYARRELTEDELRRLPSKRNPYYIINDEEITV